MLLRLGRRDGQCECRSRCDAFVLFCRSTFRPAHCDFDDCALAFALVHFLLRYGKQKKRKLDVAMLITKSKIGASALEFFGLSATFWHKTGEVYRVEHPRGPEEKGGRTREALKSKITWLCAAFFFTYMGIEGTRSVPFFSLDTKY